MICAATTGRGGLSLARHVANAEVNELVEMGASRGLITDDIIGQVMEITALASHARTKAPVLHVHLDPEPGQPWSETDNLRFWVRFEAEFGLSDRPFASQFHVKDGRCHEHRQYLAIDTTGRKIKLPHDMARREKLCRIAEYEAGHPLIKGRHNRAVWHALEREGRHDVADALRLAGFLDGGPAVASLTPSERHQQERTKMTVGDMRSAVLEAYRASGAGAAFRAELEAHGLYLATGKSQVLIVDRSGGHHGLARTLRAAAKAGGSAPVSAADARALVAGIQLPTLEEVRGSLRDSSPASRQVEGGTQRGMSRLPSIGSPAGDVLPEALDAPLVADLSGDDEMAAARALRAASDQMAKKNAKLAAIGRHHNHGLAQAAQNLALTFTRRWQNASTTVLIRRRNGETQPSTAVSLPRLRSLTLLQDVPVFAGQASGASDLLQPAPFHRPRDRVERVDHLLQPQAGGDDLTGRTTRLR